MTTLILVPTPMELDYLLPLREACTHDFLCYRDGSSVWAVCGVGPAAAAFSTARLLSAFQPDRVVLVGIAGAFASSGLRPGDIVQAASETFADLGYLSDGNWTNLDGMKLDMLAMSGKQWRCQQALTALDPGEPGRTFITVSAITNSHEEAGALARSYSAEVENMEGAAVAMACAVDGIPFHEVRAISNLVGPRDPKSWMVKPSLVGLAEWLKARRVTG